jgi:pyruvate dehydrogenase phosphatase
MYLRNFSVALISGAVASGAWYAFRGTPNVESGVLSNINHPSSAGSQSGALAISNTYSNSPQPTIPGSGTVEELAASTRRALVVENDQFYTGDIVGDQPLSKETGGSGRVVVEMLTPEQATQKLRQNEESYAVGRGRGVVRYDVTQLASNNPIEDDHTEKILEVSQTIAATQDGSPASDWMFWGVFDGHRFV